jgi:hypothetical protein
VQRYYVIALERVAFILISVPILKTRSDALVDSDIGRLVVCGKELPKTHGKITSKTTGRILSSSFESSSFLPHAESRNILAVIPAGFFQPLDQLNVILPVPYLCKVGFATGKYRTAYWRQRAVLRQESVI